MNVCCLLVCEGVLHGILRALHDCVWQLQPPPSPPSPRVLPLARSAPVICWQEETFLRRKEERVKENNVEGELGQNENKKHNNF